MSKCLKVNFCAAPSSGKSTVCSALESKLKEDGIIVDTSKEYARQYINTYGVPEELFELMIIVDNQLTRDKALESVSEILISDRSVVNDYIFANRMLYEKVENEGRNRNELNKREYKFLEEMHTTCLKHLHWFDLVFVFPPLTEIIPDGTRNEDKKAADEIYRATIGFLEVEGVNYYLIDGSVEEKKQKCYEIIKEKYNELNLGK